MSAEFVCVGGLVELVLRDHVLVAYGLVRYECIKWWPKLVWVVPVFSTQHSPPNTQTHSFSVSSLTPKGWKQHIGEKDGKSSEKEMKMNLGSILLAQGNSNQ